MKAFVSQKVPNSEIHNSINISNFSAYWQGELQGALSHDAESLNLLHIPSSRTFVFPSHPND